MDVQIKLFASKNPTINKLLLCYLATIIEGQETVFITNADTVCDYLRDLILEEAKQDPNLYKHLDEIEEELQDCLEDHELANIAYTVAAKEVSNAY